MELNRDIFFLFFKGELDPEQASGVISWAKESPENYAMLESERKLFDMVNLADDSCFEAPAVRKIHFPWKMLSIAAGLAVIMASALLLSTRGSQNVLTADTCITAPSGARSQVTLPDGTQVWLNSGSTMKYSTLPAGKGKREVQLDGQARFDVARDEKHPFVVHTYVADIEVLGTSFDVTADEQRNIFETALFSGRVSVSAPGGKGDRYELLPNQKISLTGQKLSTDGIEDFDVYQWVDGLYSFKDRAFSQIIVDMEKYFGTKIVSDLGPGLGQEKLTGKFRISDGLDFALRVLQISMDFDYRFDENNETVTISRK